MSNQLQQTMQAAQALSPTEQLELVKFMLAQQSKQKLTLFDQIFQLLREWSEGMVYPPTKTPERILGLNAGTVWVSPDFDEPLPDEFWQCNMIEIKTIEGIHHAKLT